MTDDSDPILDEEETPPIKRVDLNQIPLTDDDAQYLEEYLALCEQFLGDAETTGWNEHWAKERERVDQLKAIGHNDEEAWRIARLEIGEFDRTDCKIKLEDAMAKLAKLNERYAALGVDEAILRPKLVAQHLARESGWTPSLICWG